MYEGMYIIILINLTVDTLHSSIDILQLHVNIVV